MILLVSPSLTGGAGGARGPLFGFWGGRVKGEAIGETRGSWARARAEPRPIVVP